MKISEQMVTIFPKNLTNRVALSNFGMCMDMFPAILKEKLVNKYCYNLELTLLAKNFLDIHYSERNLNNSNYLL